MSSRTSKPVWERSAPAKSKHTKLSPKKKAAAKARAQRAGRPYPNLVDNMRAAKSATKRKATTKRKASTKRKATAKRKTSGAR